MSYNIDTVTTLVNEDAFISAKDVVRLYKRFKNKLPESNLLDDLIEEARRSVATAKDGDDAWLEIPDLFQWQGESSGWSERILIKHVAPCIIGRLDLVFAWEGGDSFSGLRIRDGKVFRKDVEFRLVKKG